MKGGETPVRDRLFPAEFALFRGLLDFSGPGDYNSIWFQERSEPA